MHMSRTSEKWLRYLSHPTSKQAPSSDLLERREVPALMKAAELHGVLAILIQNISRLGAAQVFRGDGV